MSIFDLHARVLEDYRDFVRSFFLIADDRARAFVDQALEEEQHLWPEPLLQLSPAYAAGPRVDELARAGLVLQETARIFSHPDGTPFRKKRHPGEILLINASKLFAKGRPKNYLADEHVAQIARLYHEWKAEEGVSAIITGEEAARNDYNLSPSRYVATNDKEDVLPLEEAVVLLSEAEEERAVADRALEEVLRQLRLKG